jgi:hypothetical protein
MTTTRNTLFGPIALGVTLMCMGAAAFAAPNPNTYLNGTYVIVSFDDNNSPFNPSSKQITVTFDGAGNYSATEIKNTGGVITTGANSGTYAVASNGTFTVDPGSPNMVTGEISADGNTVVITQLSSGEKPEIDVGIKQGLISNFNVASGLVALASNTTGTNNSAVGTLALTSNTSGLNNTAFGYGALYSNTIGKGNAAQGTNALYSNTTGIRNLGIGNNALYGNVSGGYNIALGYNAGYNVTTGSNNIEIGASGTASDNGTIQIGSQGTQISTTIAGIYGTPVTGSAVYVTATGQLGVQASSERYKTDIATMPELSGKLAQLRPVTFHYRTDPKGVRQYGLIAEEVDQVYPELVIRDEKGKIQGVHYEELAPMLLSEVQKQRGELREQQATVKALAAQNALEAREIRELKQQQRNQLAAQAAQLQNLQRQLTELLVNKQSGDKLVAQR